MIVSANNDIIDTIKIAFFIFLKLLAPIKSAYALMPCSTFISAYLQATDCIQRRLINFFTVLQAFTICLGKDKKYI